MPIAVLADIVRSRALTDRTAAQAATEGYFRRVEEDIVAAPGSEPRRRTPADAFAPAVQPLRSTVGDEFQGIYGSLGDALARILLIRLALPADLECRFGIGSGTIASVASGDRDDLQDGSAWWSAREAIDAAHALQDDAVPRARSWFVADRASDIALADFAPLVNAYLLARDHLVDELSPRARRSVYGWLVGERQVDVARALGISQSAVSQALRTGPAEALVAGWNELVRGGMPWRSRDSS